MELSNIVQSIKKHFFKSISVTLSSFTVSTIFVGILKLIYDHVTKHSLEMTFILLFSLAFVSALFIGVDWFTGMVISKRVRSEKISSSKVSMTTSKFVALVLYMTIASILIMLFPNNYIITIVTFGPIFLSIAREFISIGENFETLYGDRPYIFKIADRLFNVFENKYFTLIEKKLFNKDKK